MAQTVLITGASRGFGKEAALLSKEKGWNVAATMRTPEQAESRTRAVDLFTPQLDVTDRASMKAAIDQTIERFGRIDVLVNNAGFACWVLSKAYHPRTLQTNSTQMFWV